jgi:hypothetical protein
MSLLSFVKKRLEDVHKNAQAITPAKKPAVPLPSAPNRLQGGVQAPRGPVSGPVIPKSAQVPAAQDGALRIAEPIVQTVKHTVVDLPKSVYDIGRGVAASVTGNKVALKHANEAKAKDEGAFLQPIARPVMQAVRTLEHPLTPNSYQAKGKDAQTIFGKEPVQNVAAGVKSNYDQHPDLPKGARLLLAGAYGTGQVLQDAATIAGAKVAGGKIIEGATDAARSGKKVLLDAQGRVTGEVPQLRQLNQSGHALIRDGADGENIQKGEQPNSQIVPDGKGGYARIPLNPNALKQSTKADAPTKLSDALLVKKAQLEAAQANAAAAPEAPVIQPVPGAKPVRMSSVKVDPSTQTDVSKFPTRLLQEERTTPLHEELNGQATHQVLTNKDVLAATQANITKNEDAALQFAKRGTSTEANATALQLLNHYLETGQFEKASDLNKTVLPRFTKQGQETQILASYSKMTPVGAVKYAQREVDKAAQDTIKGGKLEDEVNTTSKTVKKAARDVAKQLDDEIKAGKLGAQKPSNGGSGDGAVNTRPTAKKPGNTPEERLAARIKASEDKKTTEPDPITDMVNTLHQVAKEVLPEDARASIPRDPMELIGLAVKDDQNYRGVYDRAKAIVMDRYKDNPAALQELEQYFSNDAARAYAQSQVNAGVQSGLKGIDLGALVKEHYTKVDELGQDLKTKLIERAGLDEGQATQLAGDIQKRYNELVQARKDSLIKQIFGDKPTPKQKTAVDKIFQYENIGALSKDELRPLVGEKLGIPSLSEKAIAEISKRANEIQQLPEGEARNQATAEMMRYIADQVPQKASEQAVSVWKAGLLSGIRTHAGNIASNATFGVLKKASDVTATLADQAIQLGTGKRTKTLTMRGVASGTKEGVKNAGHTLKTGMDKRNFGDKYEQHAELNTKNPLLKPVFAASNGVFRLLGSADQPTYYAELKNSLYDQAKADGITKGIHGAKLKTHMEELVKNPTAKMVKTAKNEADKSVLGFDTFASKAVQGIHKGIDHFADGSPAGKAVAHAAVNILAPFVRVPSAFISRTIDFTPLGPIKEGIRQAFKHEFDQRAMSQAIGEGATGTGIIALGIALSHNGLISGDYPKTDPKEGARWKADGITPNSVKIGNKWISLNYLGPVGLLFNAGHQMEQAKGESAQNKAGAAIAGLGQGLLGQSFLQGFSGFSDAINDPERSAKSYINSQGSSIVPGISNDIATATDKYQRNADTLPQAITNRIPGAREKNPIKTDIYGNEIKRQSSAADTANPLRPSTSLTNDVKKEVDRLHSADPNNGDLQVTPTQKTDVNIEGKVVKLDAKQKYALNNKVGQAVQKNWGEFIKTNEYQALSNADKASALSSLRKDVSTLTERQYVLDNNLGTYSKSPSRAVQALGQGEANLADYATKTSQSDASGVVLNKKLDGTSKQVLTKYNAMSTKDRDSASYSQSDFDYKVAQAKYNNNVADGSLSKAGKIKADAALAKAKVGATYSRDVRDLYGLSNDDLSAYLAANESGVDKKKLADDIVAYGDALASAGVVDKNKFRTKKGVLTLGNSPDGTSPSGRSSSKGSKFKTVSIPSIKSNSYKNGGKKTYKQSKLPTIKANTHHSNYKTTQIASNLNRKLRKA